MVVDFTVEYNCKILEMHGLMAARDIEDCQAMMMQLQAIVFKKCLFIGPAMKEVF